MIAEYIRIPSEFDNFPYHVVKEEKRQSQVVAGFICSDEADQHCMYLNNTNTDESFDFSLEMNETVELSIPQ